MRPNLVSVFTGTILVLYVTSVSGCGGADDGLQRVSVSGSVTLNGEPVPNGVIRFAPTAETQGPMASAMISDGRYQIPQNQGPVAGEYEVRVQAYADPNAESPAPSVPSGTDKLGPKMSNNNADVTGNNSSTKKPAPVETKQTFKATIPESPSFEQDFAL